MKFVLASNNRGKLDELGTLLAPFGAQLVSQGELGVGEAEETGLSFIENAIIKARFACSATGLPAIADDSGLEVDALGGKPGIYSARFAGDNTDDRKNNAYLLELMKDVPAPGRQARFRCAMAFMRHADDPAPVIAEGVFEGRILESPRGANGFGYDPLFLVPGLNRTCAELEMDEKNRISHRARASQELVEKLAAFSLLYP